MLYKFSLLSLALFSSSIEAIALNHGLAAATNTPQEYGAFPHTSIPSPTQAPNPHDFELRRRESAQRTLLAAPDNTCGYFSGISGQPWGCSSGGNCVFATPTPTDIIIANSTSAVPIVAGSILCCDPKTGCPSSPAPTACVDKGRYDYATACTGSCSDDPMTLKCTEGINIYCNTILFPTPFLVTAIFCDYLSTYSPHTASTSYAGQVGHALTPTTPVFAVSTTALPPSNSSQTAISRSANGSSTPTAAAAGGTKKSVGKGPIIGGVVGGLAGLALIAGTVLFVLKRRRDSGVEEGQSEGKTITPPVETVGVKPTK